MTTYSMQPPMPPYPHQYQHPSPPCSHLPYSSLPTSRSVNMSVYHRYSDRRDPSPPRARASATPEADRRPFLPSISNLLGIADGDRPRMDGTPKQPPPPRSQPDYPYRARTPQLPPSPRSVLMDTTPDEPARLLPAMNTSASIPQAPPSPWHPSIESATTSPSIASINTPSRHIPISALNNAEPCEPPVHTRAASAPYHSPPTATSPHVVNRMYSPGAMSTASSTHSAHSAGTVPSIHGGAGGSASSAGGLSPWPTHHHYINASTAAATFPQSQDRYVCPKCSKAFSRPSSLKIHSHSHTGEKPFVCPYPQCGKSFSVRSNMRRHERGCHSPPRR